jgi:CHAT domain-containing protein
VAAALKGGRFGAVQAHVGRDALEERLQAVKSPRVLHLATHGFYFPPPEKPGRAAGLKGRLQQAGNPLLRSGVVLAGANRWRDRPPPGADLEDGWVTAEEAALLDLRGTELVVLSACEAGLGDIRAGEGVYVLRRAFLYAGARAVVATLEVVPDAEARELMRQFYARLGSGAGRADALRDAQRAVLAERRKAGAAHPFFWATCVLIGDGN